MTKDELESIVCPACKFRKDCKKDIVVLPSGTIVRYPCGYTEKVK